MPVPGRFQSTEDFRPVLVSVRLVSDLRDFTERTLKRFRSGPTFLGRHGTETARYRVGQGRFGGRGSGHGRNPPDELVDMPKRYEHAADVVTRHDIHRHGTFGHCSRRTLLD